jgi:hypothetical protein
VRTHFHRFRRALPLIAAALSCLLAPGLSGAPLALSQVSLPGHAHLVYDTGGSFKIAGFSVPIPVHGVTQTDWRFSAGHFDSSLDNQIAEFNQTSSGVLRPEAGLAPERYTEKRHHRAEISARFSWDTRHVTFSQSPAVLEAPDGIQDRLSVQFQMSVLRQAYPERFAPGAHFSMTVAGSHDFAEWNVSVCCEDAVATANGPMAAIRIHSSRADGVSKEALDMWLAPKLRWFPARVRLIDRDGNVVDSVLQSATID